jgi:hypothetical protein
LEPPEAEPPSQEPASAAPWPPQPMRFGLSRTFVYALLGLVVIIGLLAALLS